MALDDRRRRLVFGLLALAAIALVLHKSALSSVVLQRSTTDAGAKTKRQMERAPPERSASSSAAKDRVMSGWDTALGAIADAKQESHQSDADDGDSLTSGADIFKKSGQSNTDGKTVNLDRQGEGQGQLSPLGDTEIAEVKKEVRLKPVFSEYKSGYEGKVLYDPKLNLTRLDGNELWWVKIKKDRLVDKNFNDVVKIFPTSINNFAYPETISGEHICEGDPPYLLIIILSTVESFELRTAQRETWLKAAESNTWPHHKVNKRIVHGFLISDPSRANEGSNKEKLLKESEQNKDIVLLDFDELTSTVSHLVLGGLSWVQMRCKSTQFIQKVSQDTMLNVPHLVALLGSITADFQNNTCVVGGGKEESRGELEVSRGSRDDVTEAQYVLPNWPNHFHGFTYSFGVTSLPYLLQMAEKLMVLPPESAFITGVLPKRAGVARLTTPSYPTRNRAPSACNMVYGYKIATAAVRDANDLRRIWDAIGLNRCDDIQ